MSLVVRMGAEASSAAAFALVRDIPGLEVAFSSDAVWLRDQSGDASNLQRLRALRHEAVYRTAEDEVLIPLGSRLPTARLPELLRWQGLKGWLDLKSPVAALPGLLEDSSKLSLMLQRDVVESTEPNLLLAQLSDLEGYVARAADVRLKGLSFAASGDGQVLLRGCPLPPIRGCYFALGKWIAIPLGFRLSIPVRGDVVRNALGLSDGEFAVMYEDQSITRVHGDDFLSVSRSAVRLTVERLGVQPLVGEAG
ncbi:hypothetical protein N9039_01010 [Verrucomicrobiales bacterium]|nr:hypothetical protein [Verrucomicrobiales bacterium]MDB4527062.1 hypothetical protein [bacterium]